MNHREVMQAALDEIQSVLAEAHDSAYPVCCGRPGLECCGCPEPEWPGWAQKVMDGLGESERSIRNELAKPSAQGWYCAHCERGVDPSEVTFNEAHEACGRIITNDEPPTAKPAAVPDTCRQKLKKEGKPYPRSSCNFCGQLSPRWRDCDAMLYASPQPTAPAVSPVDVEAVPDGQNIKGECQCKE
jgi:hypothetical protein